MAGGRLLFPTVGLSSSAASSNLTGRDFAYCSRQDDRGLFGTPVLLKRVTSGKQPAADAQEPVSGRWIGMLKVSRGGVAKLKEVMAELRERPDFDALDMPALMNALIA